MYFKSILVLTLTLLLSSSVLAQDPTRFQSEVDHLQNKEFTIDDSKETIVFTGSSSVRMWDNVEEEFPGVNVLNTGFGGSQFSDLIYYREELIFKHNPDKIFIYEIFSVNVLIIFIITFIQSERTFKSIVKNRRLTACN
jgi:hypothetical protein